MYIYIYILLDIYHISPLDYPILRQDLRQVAQAQSQVAQVAQAQRVQAAQEPLTAEAGWCYAGYHNGDWWNIDMSS